LNNFGILVAHTNTHSSIWLYFGGWVDELVVCDCVWMSSLSIKLYPGNVQTSLKTCHRRRNVSLKWMCV